MALREIRRYNRAIALLAPYINRLEKFLCPMKISDVMTPCPYKIEAAATVTDAITKMELRNIRHLPVVEEGRMLGVITMREAELAVALGSGEQLVESVCSHKPLVVKAEEDLGAVTRKMAENKIECALVAGEDDSLQGIFTTTDACRLIHLILEEIDNRDQGE